MTLLVIAVWLRKLGKSSNFALVPMVFVLVMTTWALVRIVIDKSATATQSFPAAANAITAVLLLALAGYLLVAGLRSMWTNHAVQDLAASRAGRPLH
jgi:carbon starvation protein CstA